jgi:hypothetical protein
MTSSRPVAVFNSDPRSLLTSACPQRTEYWTDAFKKVLLNTNYTDEIAFCYNLNII